MKFNAYLPVGNVTPGQFQSKQAIKEMVTALEKAKFAICCVTDHPAPSSAWLHASGHDALDPFTALAVAAAYSESLLLQTNILVLPYRNPFITAKAATTLQVLSDNRFIMGVGTGYQKEEFDALGIDFHKRGKLTDEALQTLAQIWRGGSIVAEGLNFNAVGNEPRPTPAVPPKIWIGGSSAKAMERAAKADGWCPFFSVPRLTQSNQDTGIHTAKDLQEKIEQLRTMRSEVGNSPECEITVAPALRLKSIESPETERYIEQLIEMKSAGVTCATVYLPHPSRASYLENIQWFKEVVVPQLG
ncbi:TIGR03619 family F420-dependent LLM class oxidoreductase [Halioxenophilus sp. WMMB6]|uniref:TIGR03619 family F420-dependent LLM class oxidoreductase n=1 Tax=Halioxenophilus sp. WMMB6 TaxID=3073815 RepID=UPI00295F0A88|nr:TIGR03619 family F420-dependent LLM class oxidoreductase [Halioxenophilus sp. WMMB6]